MKILSYSLCGAGAGFLFAILSYFIELSLIEIYIFIDKEGISKGSKYGKKALFISWDDIEMIKTKEICLTENWSAKVVRFVKYGLLLYRKKEEKIKVICISSKHIRLIDTNDCKSIFNSKSSIVLRYTEERLALLKRYLPNT